MGKQTIDNGSREHAAVLSSTETRASNKQMLKRWRANDLTCSITVGDYKLEKHASFF